MCGCRLEREERYSAVFVCNLTEEEFAADRGRKQLHLYEHTGGNSIIEYVLFVMNLLVFTDLIRAIGMLWEKEMRVTLSFVSATFVPKPHVSCYCYYESTVI